MDMPKILVVDDEEDLCEILKFNLEIEGYEVDTASSAEEALKTDITSYQLLLLDVMMGETSGFKMASILKERRKDGRYPHHLPDSQRHRKRHADRLQLRSRRLYIQAFLPPPGNSTCESRTAPYIGQGESARRRMPPDTRPYHLTRSASKHLSTDRKSHSLKRSSKY